MLQGLPVKFDALLMMRQAHGFAFGKSDMFMLCAAKLDPSKDYKKDDTGRPVALACEKARPPPSRDHAGPCLLQLDTHDPCAMITQRRGEV